MLAGCVAHGTTLACGGLVRSGDAVVTALGSPDSGSDVDGAPVPEDGVDEAAALETGESVASVALCAEHEATSIMSSNDQRRIERSLALIYVDQRKWGDRQHYGYAMRLLGYDHFGMWLGGGRNRIVRRPDGRRFMIARPVLQLVPRHAWWTASFDLLSWCEVYVNISTPVRRTPGLLRMIDLDLDVIRFDTGRTLLVDQDEFDEHRVAYAYPLEVVDRVRAEAAKLERLVSTRAEPFGRAAAPWFVERERRFGA